MGTPTVTIGISAIGPEQVEFTMSPTFGEMTKRLQERGWLSKPEWLARYATTLLPPMYGAQLRRAPAFRERPMEYTMTIVGLDDGGARLDVMPIFTLEQVALNGMTLAQACVSRIWRGLKEQQHNERPTIKLILPPGSRVS